MEEKKGLTEEDIQNSSISEADKMKIDDLTSIENKKISFDSDETIEFQIFSKIRNTKRHIEKEKKRAYEAALKKASVTRYKPDKDKGLDNLQVQARQGEGLTNRTPNSYTKSIWKIIRSNVFTYFNILMIVLAILMLSFGDVLYTDFLFVYIVAFNLIIGTVEEIHAKKITDKMKLLVTAKALVIRESQENEIDPSDLVLDDLFRLQPGAQIPADGLVLEGNMEVNEALQTGESKPVNKKAGDKLMSGSFVVSGQALCQVESVGEDTFSGKIAMQAKKQKKNTSVLYRTINKFIAIISFVVIPLGFLIGLNNYWAYAKLLGEGTEAFSKALTKTCTSMIGMIPSGLVLLTSVALTVGVIKLSKQNTLVQDLYSIERLARVDCLCFDKTGTLTDGTLKVQDSIKTDEGFNDKSIMSNYLMVVQSDNQTGKALKAIYGEACDLSVTKVIPFSSERKFSSVVFKDEGTFFLGAPEYLLDIKSSSYGSMIKAKQEKGNRVIVLVKQTEKGNKLEMIFVIEDHIRDSACATVKWFNENSVQIKVISGDSPVTVSEIARKCGIYNSEKYVSLEGMSLKETAALADEFTIFGRVSPEQKAALIKALKARGKSVAMTGDGINDILAMKQADCAVAMAAGAGACRSAAHVILMNSDFGSMPSIVREGRRVVNNIQTSSSLFIMKTLFNIVLCSIILILGLFKYHLFYPFDPHHLFLLEILPIGLDAFFLGLQPNDKIIKGNFGAQVFKRAIPVASCLVVSVLILMILKENAFGQVLADSTLSKDEIDAAYTTLMVLCVDSIAFVYLIYLCLPFNLYRLILASVSVFIYILAVLFAPEKFTGVTISLISGQMMAYFGIAMAVSVVIIFGTGIFLYFYEKKKSRLADKTD